MKTCLTLLTLAAAGCAAPPRARYVAAINAQYAGNPNQSEIELMALALDEPHTRAGRLARARLTGTSVYTSVMAMSMVSGVAVPSFLRFQARARQTEAKVALRAAALALEAYRAEHGTYPADPGSALTGAFEPLASYCLFYSAQMGFEGQTMSLDEAGSVLDTLGIEPQVGPESFSLVAIGNVDADVDPDVWLLTQDGALEHLFDDVE